MIDNFDIREAMEKAVHLPTDELKAFLLKLVECRGPQVAEILLEHITGGNEITQREVDVILYTATTAIDPNDVREWPAGWMKQCQTLPNFAISPLQAAQMVAKLGDWDEEGDCAGMLQVGNYTIRYKDGDTLQVAVQKGSPQHLYLESFQ
jgi:hypothetical protein